MRIVLLSEVLSRSEKIGREYAEEVIKSGRVVRKILYLPEGEYDRLQRKYASRPPHPRTEVLVLDSILHSKR